MDLTKGTDDQYYDYSPSQVEAIIFGIPQLTPEHQDYIITGLKKHLREFIQDEEQDEDMISQYTATYNALENGNPTKEKSNSLIPWLHQNLLDNLINNHYGKLI